MVPFVDVQANMRVHGEALEAALIEVVRSGQFINGPQVQELEERLRAHVGVEHAVACGNGTAAEHLLLMALGIGPGDEVIVPDFTFIATAEAVALLGAKIVTVDVEPDSFTMDPASLRAAMGARVKAVVPVSIFGHPADFKELQKICDEYGVTLLEDACQSLGGRRDGVNSGAFGRAAFTSFYPSKPLGGIGDGGMVFTQDGELASRLRGLREHGTAGRHYHTQLGLNSRLDTLQAAAMLVKLRAFEAEVERRCAAARRYDRALAGVVRTPAIAAGVRSSYAQYTIQVEDGAARERLVEHLERRGVPTAIHYPQPIHTQPSLQGHVARAGVAPVTERLNSTVVSLPLSAYMADEDQQRVIDGVLEWASLAGRAATGAN